MAAASTPNAVPAGPPCSPAPACRSPRRVPGRRPPYLVMRDRVPQRRRIYPQATYNGGVLRTLARIYLCAGLIVTFLVVVL